MEILEFGNLNDKKLVLIHGFQCPYTILDDYINYYKKDFHIIVPVLPGHNPNKKEEFISIQQSVKEFEEYFTARYGNEIYAVYGMSVGGVFACELWKNQNISIEKLIIESSPLLPFGRRSINFATNWYLKMSNKVRNGNKKTLKKAEKNMIPEKLMPDFQEVVKNMSDQSIRNYISEAGQFKITQEELGKIENTKVIYFYGGKFSEILFKKVGHFIKRNYKLSTIKCLKGKKHCEDSLHHSDQWIFTLNHIL